MNAKNRNYIPDNIFIKCLYSAHHNLISQWDYSDTNTNYCNLVLVCGGKGIFTCGDEEIAVTRGDLVYFPENVSRTMHTDDELEFRSFNFRYKLVFEHWQDWWTEFPPLPLPFVTKIDDSALFARFELLFEQIQRHYTSLQYSDSFRMRFYATEVLYLLLSESQRDISYSERNMINKTIEYMSQNFRKKITLKELADISQKSVSYYGKTFKKVLGVTPIDYLLSIRIEYAKKLLENGSSVSETASLCGFSNLYYFSKAFKTREHMSPSQYRDML